VPWLFVGEEMVPGFTLALLEEEMVSGFTFGFVVREVQVSMSQ